jgi:hypothetical protein
MKLKVPNVAAVLVDTLIANGVERVWGLLRDSLNGVTDEIGIGGLQSDRPVSAWLDAAYSMK